ncbi:hypothetical protein GNF10_26405 [Nostoc sp. UCD121]|uniref:hypothetical protein n=1 Tax=unclassified Nostoc TaxID=2593658 RepID=UPI00162768C1|nr:MULTISPECIES: hypothetical protein [unclassified Nostoc]MBC1223143.1 hypothetical protein [Nostoc sp. UCD120]MBC1279394.1 hypothetical protein [Nostoc sp. UCD121]MBC1293649.1 hypothetical protein [Nostoc sp. UCD122]
MSKHQSFIQPLLKPWQTLTALMVVGVIALGSGVGKSIYTSLFSIQPAYAQRITPSDVWQLVYQQLPDLPRENKYISKENGKVAENSTLANRLIRYHIYTKGRAPVYRLDWKLTLADYLGANEIMYDNTYPGYDSLRENPMEGDRKAITRLTRSQRDALVQVLVNIFNPTSQNTQSPKPNTAPNPSTSTTPQPSQRGGAELLK